MEMATVESTAPNGRAPDEAELAQKAKDADKAHEPLEGEDDGEQAPPALPPIELEGSGDQLTLKITGDKPDSAKAKMVGGKMDIPKGEYQPGDVVEAVVRMRCVSVAVIDKMNNTTGERSEREREHKFKMLGIEKLGK